MSIENVGIKEFPRRAATILSADVAGYCLITQLDDEFTLVQLLKYRQIINDIVTRRKGRMFGVAGDSWMAEFPNPLTAVRCAIEGQRALEECNLKLPENRRIRFRMGLHMGDVLVPGADLFGEQVIISARLQELSRPGHLVISEIIFRNVVGKVDVRFYALGPRRLKHISEPVTAFAAEVIANSGANLPDDLISAIDVSQPVPEFEGRPAIAVLPFRMFGDVQGNEHIGEGLAEDLVNRLSNVRWFPVISRFSSFVFKDHTLDTRSIGATLGSRYLVTGSVRLAGQDLRLIVDLIDAESGANLWSHKRQIDFKDLFGVQDEIIAGIVSILDSEVDRAEQSRLSVRKPEDLDTWELIRRGIWHLYKFTREDSEVARAIFDEALKRDPDSSEARIHLAWWHFWDIWIKRGDISLLKETERLARQAMHLDPIDARAHMMVGIALMMMGQPEQARAYYLNAIGFNPSLAAAHAVLGSSFIISGEPSKAIAPLMLSVRLNPHDLRNFHYLGELAMAFYMEGHWDKACEFAERSLQFRPAYWYAKAILIGSLARSGKMEKAFALAEEQSSRFSLEQIMWVPFVDKAWNHYLLEGLQLAGCEIADQDKEL